MLFPHKLPKMNTWSCHIPLINLKWFPLSVGWSPNSLMWLARPCRGAPTASSSPIVPFPLFPVPHLKLLCAAALHTLLLPWEVHSLSLLGLCMWFSFYQKHFPLTPTFLASDFGFLWRHFLTLPVWFKHHSCGLWHFDFPYFHAYQTIS